jgi:hypothetical protein
VPRVISFHFQIISHGAVPGPVRSGAAQRGDTRGREWPDPLILIWEATGEQARSPQPHTGRTRSISRITSSRRRPERRGLPSPCDRVVLVLMDWDAGSRTPGPRLQGKACVAAATARSHTHDSQQKQEAPVVQSDRRVSIRTVERDSLYKFLACFPTLFAHGEYKYGICFIQTNSSLTKFTVNKTLAFMPPNKFIMKLYFITYLMVLILYHER